MRSFRWRCWCAQGAPKLIFRANMGRFGGSSAWFSYLSRRASEVYETLAGATILALRSLCATHRNRPKIVAMRACTPTRVQDDQLGPQKRHRGSQDAQLAAQDGFRGAQDGALGALGGVPNVPRSVPRTTLGAPRPPRSISGCDFGRLGRPRPRFWHASWTVLATCDPPCRSFGETCAATMHAPLHQRCTKVSAPSINCELETTLSKEVIIKKSI